MLLMRYVNSWRIERSITSSPPSVTKDPFASSLINKTINTYSATYDKWHSKESFKQSKTTKLKLDRFIYRRLVESFRQIGFVEEADNR